MTPCRLRDRRICGAGRGDTALGLSLLAIIAFLSVTRAPFAQAPQSGAGEPPALPAACRNLGNSDPRVGKLLADVSRRATAERYNALGAAYAEADKLDCAVAAFENALRLDDQDWRARYNLALTLVQKGEAKNAADHLRVLIQQKPEAPEAHNVLGSILRQQGELTAAEEEYKTALKCDPAFAPAALGLGQTLIDQKRYTAAKDYLQDALRASPAPATQAQLLTLLAVVFAQNGETDQAIATLERMIKDHPDDADAHFNLATVYARQGPALGYQKAIANFKDAVRLDPKYDAARYSLAKVLVQVGQFSDAVSCLDAYTRHQPKDAEGFHLLGSAHAGLDQIPKAVEALERAKQLKPGDFLIRYDLGSALAKAGKTQQAIEQLLAAEKLNPAFADTHYQLALQLRKQGDAARSQQEIQLFQKLKNQVNEATEAGNLNNEGNRFLQEGKAQEAADAYRKAVQLDPMNAQWQYNLSLALARLGDREGQKTALARALEIDPNMAAAHNDLGLLCLSEHNLESAEKEFRAALEIDPKFAEAQNNLGVVYSEQGKDSEALALFRQATQNDPHYARAFVNLGLVMARQGDLGGAREQIQQALRISPQNPGALSALEMIEGRMNQQQSPAPQR